MRIQANFVVSEYFPDNHKCSRSPYITYNLIAHYTYFMHKQIYMYSHLGAIVLNAGIWDMYKWLPAKTWRSHDTESLSALLAKFGGEIHWPPPQKEKPLWSFDVFFDVRLKQLLDKQSIWRWFTTTLQGYFTDSEAIHVCPSASEATLKYMSKYTIWIHR